MSDIDPHNLGDPVFKKDQVITDEDLIFLSQCYRQNENFFLSEGIMHMAAKCCMAHQTVEAMYEWLKKGKEKGVIGYGTDEEKDS